MQQNKCLRVFKGKHEMLKLLKMVKKHSPFDEKHQTNISDDLQIRNSLNNHYQREKHATLKIPLRVIKLSDNNIPVILSWICHSMMWIRLNLMRLIN